MRFFHKGLCNYIPEPPESPPFPDKATYERNVRNGIREEICGAIDLIDDRLGELNEEGYEVELNELAKLRERMRLERED